MILSCLLKENTGPAEQDRIFHSIKLSEASMKKVVDQGASLDGINALHMAAAIYESRDLSEYLIGEHHMSVDKVDESGNLPLHVAGAYTYI
jgi:hypothetical protein